MAAMGTKEKLTSSDKKQRNNMKTRHEIEVRRYLPGQTPWGEILTRIPDRADKGEYVLIGTIKRVLWSEAIGNFCPIFCRYKNKRTLVKSEEGDISDPFRREDSYLRKLFIIEKEEENL